MREKGDTDVQLRRDRIMDAIARAEKSGEEFCVLCGCGMGFPAFTTHIEDPIRHKGGASYIEGSGQVCADCSKDIVGTVR